VPDRVLSVVTRPSVGLLPGRGLDGGVGVVPAPCVTGAVLLTCAACSSQKSVSSLVGWAARAAPAMVPTARAPVATNRPSLMAQKSAYSVPSEKAYVTGPLGTA